MKHLALISIILFFTIRVFAQPNFAEDYPDSLNKKRLYLVAGAEAGFYVSGVSFLSFVWYKDHEQVPFHYYNDLQGYLQMDKAGHSFSAYKESAIAYHALRKAGVSKKRALIFGGPAGLILQTPVEIYDGLYEGWGFSWSDMAANTFGSLLFTTQEAIFDEQIFVMKFSYSPSIYPDLHSHLGKTQAERFFLDYNAHTYWLSGGINKLTSINKIPKWINLAFGYSANGMIYEFDNPRFYNGKPFPYLERHRQFLFSLDVNFTKIPTKKKWLKNVFRVINVIKVPFPTLEFNKVEGVKFRALYF